MTALSQSDLLQALGWAIVNSLWQMALLWILFPGILILFKIERSSHKTLLASLFLLSGFAWFIITFVSIFTKTYWGTIITPAVTVLYPDESIYNWLHNALPVTSVLYFILLIFPLIRFFRNYRFVQIIRTKGLKKIEVDWRIFITKVAGWMGVRRPVQIWISDNISSPVTVGFFKPVILVPLAAMNHLTPQQMEAVLLHELSHIRRYDYLVNLVINFIQTILYFNPFVKLFVKTIEREREKSCDETVVQFQYDTHEYASALLILEKTNHATRPLAIAASGRKSDLMQRIEVILGIHQKTNFSLNRLAGLMSGFLCIVVLNVLLIFAKHSSPVQPGKTIAASDFIYPEKNSEVQKGIAEISMNYKPDSKQNNEPVEIKKKKYQAVKGDRLAGNETANYPAHPGKTGQLIPSLYNVNYVTANTPELKSYQLAQIDEALAKSKEILQDNQWKVLEKKIADALTSEEKDQLKKAYIKEFSSLDFSKWKDRLSSAYDQIDWEHINDRLDRAVFNLKLDSLQKIYSDVAVNLEYLQNQLAEANLKAIPDSDITVKILEEHSAEVQNLLKRIKAIRDKKIIQL